MTLWDLNERLKEINENDAWHREMWRYIQAELKGVLLYYQNIQLFEQSKGADNYPLGFYSNVKNVRRKYGVSLSDANDPGRNYPFKMVETGRFKAGMYVNVDRRSRTIEFGSTAPHLADMLKNADGVFMTTNFFGLTYKHQTNFINLHVIDYMIRWQRKFLLSGKK